MARTLQQRCFRYLDELHDSEETNMMLAPSYLTAVFGRELTKPEAKRVYMLWLDAQKEQPPGSPAKP